MIPVDLLGKCVDHERIAVAARHGVRVLSDAAESLGRSGGVRPGASAMPRSCRSTATRS